MFEYRNDLKYFNFDLYLNVILTIHLYLPNKILIFIFNVFETINKQSINIHNCINHVL